jgi:hypothetical protein
MPGNLCRILLACALTALAACGHAQQPQPDTDNIPLQEIAAVDTTGLAAPVVDAQAAAADIVVPAVVAVREVVQQVLPPPAQVQPPLVSPAGVNLIVRWEVTSQARYERAYRWPIWPGGASGATWGIGYDGGHQTRQTIGDDWQLHPHVGRLQDTSGITGAAAKPVVASMRDVLTDYDYAVDVFANASLPVYHRGARRALGPHFDDLPQRARDGLVSLGYNRGWSMTGDRNREKRAIRDVCLPQLDVGCIAVQIRSMCRLWRGTNLERGLCDRRNDEARLVESTP